MQTIDCRSMPCPAPVISVKKALETDSNLRVMLDDGAPRENVSRFVSNRGFLVSEERDGEVWILNITADNTKTGISSEIIDSSTAAPVIIVTSDRLGEGPDELGKLLMKNFFHTLLEASILPARILFLNTGIFLTTDGSEIIEALKKLEGMGIEIFSCGLCLDFFERKDALCAGNRTNMLTTVESLLAAGQVIRL